MNLKFCIKLEHSSTETIQLTQKAAAVGNWWFPASSWPRACSCITSHAEFLVKHQITQVTHPPTAQIWHPATSCFTKIKIIFERKEVSDRLWYSGKHDKAADGETGRTVWGPKVPTWKGTEASLSFIQCFLYLVSSSINVSIFHITWLATFWTGLVWYRMRTRFIRVITL